MSSAPVGKCINFRACAKADRREPIALAPRNGNPICPLCSEPLLITTVIVNPRKNAFVAIGIVAVLLVVGVGLALRHSLTSGSIARAAVPAAGAATVPGSASAPTVAAKPVALAATREQTRRPANAHRVAGVVAALPPQSPGAAIPADAPSAYADLLRTSRKVDVALYFQRGSGSLDDQASGDVSRLASALKADTLRGGKVVVAGFADNTGDPEYSKLLSVQRAARVAAKLTAQGVTVSETLGFGQDAPIGDNATRAGREANRRVEIFIAR